MASVTTALEPPNPQLFRRNERPDRRQPNALRWQHWPDLECKADGSTTPQPLQCSYPDLEDESLIAWGLRKSAGASGHGIKIDVLHGSDEDLSRCCWAFDDWDEAYGA